MHLCNALGVGPPEVAQHAIGGDDQQEHAHAQRDPVQFRRCAVDDFDCLNEGKAAEHYEVGQLSKRDARRRGPVHGSKHDVAA